MNVDTEPTLVLSVVFGGVVETDAVDNSVVEGKTVDWCGVVSETAEVSLTGVSVLCGMATVTDTVFWYGVMVKGVVDFGGSSDVELVGVSLLCVVSAVLMWVVRSTVVVIAADILVGGLGSLVVGLCVVVGNSGSVVVTVLDGVEMTVVISFANVTDGSPAHACIVTLSAFSTYPGLIMNLKQK